VRPGPDGAGRDDNARRYLDILRVANRSNASFYRSNPAPRGVRQDLGRTAAADRRGLAMLRQRHETLKTAALDTDGIA